MSAARPPIHPHLDDVLARTRQPDLPAGLAARIVAQTAGLPQQLRREDIVAEVASTVVPLQAPAARAHRWMRPAVMAGGLAAAASLAVIVAPSLFLRAPAPAPIAQKQPAATPVAPEETQIATAPASSTGTPIAPLADPSHKAASTPSAPRTPATPAAALAASDDIKADDSPVTPAPNAVPAGPEKLAEVEGPKAPVQGPPVPFDLLPSSSATLGLGVTGSADSAASSPAPNAPGRGGPGGGSGGPGGSGGGFGGGGGGGGHGGPHR